MRLLARLVSATTFLIFASPLEQVWAQSVDLSRARRDVGYVSQRIYQSYGVKVHYRYNRHTFFPKNWLHPPRSVKGEAVSATCLYLILPHLRGIVDRRRQVSSLQAHVGHTVPKKLQTDEQSP